MTTQTESSITDQIEELIIQQVHCPRELIVPEAEFLTDLSFDSLDVTEFMLNIEERFDIEVADEDVDQLKTVQDVLSKVEQALKK